MKVKCATCNQLLHRKTNYRKAFCIECTRKKNTLYNRAKFPVVNNKVIDFTCHCGKKLNIMGKGGHMAMHRRDLEK